MLAPAQTPPPARAPATASAASAPRSDSANCAGDLYRQAGEAPVRARARRLGELPPGDLQFTVLRRSGECFGPVIVREGYGAMWSGGRR
jgi:hypothetical protein